MSRYFLLFLLNLPFVVMAILGAITRYKLSRSSGKKLAAQLILWGIVLIGLAGAQPFYEWLIKNNFTATEPLSLFDVVQITSIVIVFYIANRAAAKAQMLEKRVQDLHQELSIQLSVNKSK